MGSYLNPGNALFKMAVNSQIFVDKSMLGFEKITEDDHVESVESKKQ